jgi:hypothetical protein
MLSPGVAALPAMVPPVPKPQFFARSLASFKKLVKNTATGLINSYSPLLWYALETPCSTIPSSLPASNKSWT